MELKIVFFIVLAVAALAEAGLITSNDNDGDLDLIIELPSIMAQVEGSQRINSLQGKQKVAALVSTLQELAQRSQAPYLAKLTQLGLEYEGFWANNIILVKNLQKNETALEALKTFIEKDGDGQAVLRPQHVVTIDGVFHKDKASPNFNVNVRQGVQWGVERIRAPEAWNITRGEGITVGSVDTGVNLDHVALSGNYAGVWYDAFDPSSTTPSDPNGHGTHTLGTIVGQTNGIGIAPLSQWVACRGLNPLGSGTEGSLTACAQFMINANPMPRVINNAWGGGQGQTWFNNQILVWRMAGIIPIFTIGNSGPPCGSANSPGDQPNVIAVGSTMPDDSMTTSSSRGPAGGGTTIKPELAAPGNEIISAGTGTNDYVTMSGVSAPHVAGAAALVLSAHPDYGFEEVFEALTSKAEHPPLSNADRNCGLGGPGDFPNNAYGYGRVDVAAALGM